MALFGSRPATPRRHLRYASCFADGPSVPLSLFRRSRKRRSPRGLRRSLLMHYYLRTKAVRVATASERPSVGPGRARGDGPARILLWHPGQYEVPTNDELRHQPARPETRPNQRLYVPLGSPPSVAVGSSSARAAHRSRAPQIDSLRMTSRIRYPRRGRACAAPNDLPPPCCADFAYRLGDYCLS